MIAWVLGGVFVFACLIWAGSWVIQIGVALAVILFRVAVMLGQAIGLLIAGLCWCVWWCINREAAMASLKKAQDRG